MGGNNAQITCTLTHLTMLLIEKNALDSMNDQLRIRNKMLSKAHYGTIQSIYVSLHCLVPCTTTVLGLYIIYSNCKYGV